MTQPQGIVTAVRASLIAVCCLLLSPAAAAAQDRPFIFSVATGAGASTTAPQIRVDYELGLGDSAFHQQSSQGPEQRIGVHATRGRLTFIGHVGLATAFLRASL